VPTAYVLLNSDLGSDESIISKVKEILENEEKLKKTLLLFFQPVGRKIYKKNIIS